MERRAVDRKYPAFQAKSGQMDKKYPFAEGQLRTQDSTLVKFIHIFIGISSLQRIADLYLKAVAQRLLYYDNNFEVKFFGG